MGSYPVCLLHYSITPSLHSAKWSARQDLHLRSLGPRPSVLLLHYALIALIVAIEPGRRTQDNKPWNRSCGKILNSALYTLHSALRTPHSKMALPAGLAPTFFP